MSAELSKLFELSNNDEAFFGFTNKNLKAIDSSQSESEDEFLGFSPKDVDQGNNLSDFSNLKDHDSNSKSSGFYSGESSSDSDSDEELNPALLRKKQMKLLNDRKKILDSLMRTPSVRKIISECKHDSEKKPKRRSRTFNNFTRIINSTRVAPVITRRRSKYGGQPLENGLEETKTLRSRLTIKFKTTKRQYNSGDEREEEYIPKKRRSYSKASEHVIIPVEDVTQYMLENIAHYSVGKTYDAVIGTSCHQCRQKTTDTKSCCRSQSCIGIRGQFCGPCLKNRYGELVEDTLLNPNWECPVCRGFCNCSICRNRDGKCATGILIGLAKNRGFSNVKDYLAHINKEEFGAD